jgi:hypothetical protein
MRNKGSLTSQILGTLGILAHFRHSLHVSAAKKLVATQGPWWADLSAGEREGKLVER